MNWVVKITSATLHKKIKRQAKLKGSFERSRLPVMIQDNLVYYQLCATTKRFSSTQRI